MQTSYYILRSLLSYEVAQHYSLFNISHTKEEVNSFLEQFDKTKIEVVRDEQYITELVPKNFKILEKFIVNSSIQDFVAPIFALLVVEVQK